jgi:hypothetical protein
MFSAPQRFFCAVAIGLSGLTAAAAGQSDGKPATACKQIRTAAQLQAMQNDLAGSYCLANDIDASSIPNFAPIGTASPYFTGRLYGNGHVIRNLTINSAASDVGMIGVMRDGLIQDVGLVNVNVTATGPGAFAGGLVGDAEQGGGPVTITRAYSTGQVKCMLSCNSGGLIGGFLSSAPLTDVWSSANVVGDGLVGGLVGNTVASAVSRGYATGSVGCITANCVSAGGLIGKMDNGGSVSESYASGTVAGGTRVSIGGLVGFSGGGGTISRSYATGSVQGGDNAIVGSLVGVTGGGSITESYGAGRLTGGAGVSLGGLIGLAAMAPTVTNAYWDNVTTGQATSSGGFATGLTTTQLRGALPSEFGGAWGITRTLSYPFLKSPGFTSALATLAGLDEIFTFLPIGQLDETQYATAPHHANGAALATVYTMIARAVGLTENAPSLANATIDKFFWHDDTQTTTFIGPIKFHTILGPLTDIAAATQLTTANVIGEMNVHRLVVLRGTFSKGNGGTATHWMLATLYTKVGGSVQTIVANDPWTGTQVEINPITKKVVTPSNFPLKDFTVDGYQAVTVN